MLYCIICVHTSLMWCHILVLLPDHLQKKGFYVFFSVVCFSLHVFCILFWNYFVCVYYVWICNKYFWRKRTVLTYSFINLYSLCHICCSGLFLFHFVRMSLLVLQVRGRGCVFLRDAGQQIYHQTNSSQGGPVNTCKS